MFYESRESLKQKPELIAAGSAAQKVDFIDDDGLQILQNFSIKCKSDSVDSGVVTTS